MAKKSISERDLRNTALSPELTANRLPGNLRGAILSAAATAVIAALVLIGWGWNIEVLKRIVPGLVAMNPMSAVTFLIAAFCLGNFAAQKRTRLAAASLWVGRVGAIFVGLVGALQLLAILSGRDSHFDQWLFRAKLAVESVPNTMAPNTAFNFLLIGCALLFLQTRNRRVSACACIFALIAGFEALLVIIGYTYRVHGFYGIGSHIPMAFHTAICFALLVFGIMSYQANRGFLAIILGETAGGRMARRLLPAAILVPAVLGWLRLEGQRMGLYDPDFGVALYTVTNMLVFAGVVSCNAYSLFRSDARRAKSEVRLRRAYGDLEAQGQALLTETESLSAEIAERKRLENVQAHFAAIVESSADAITSKTLDGVITSWNPAAEKIFGYTAQEAIGQPMAMLIPPERADEESQILARLKTGGYLEHFDTVRLRKDGKRIHVSVTISPLKDASGKIVGASKVARDISEEKELDEALRESKRQLEDAVQAHQLVMDNSRDVICTVDEAGRFVTVSAASEAVWGYAPSELVGRRYIDLVYPEDRPKTLEIAEAIIAGKPVVDFENCYVRKNGSLISVLWSAYWSEADKTMFAVAHDISVRKQAEEALRESQARLASSAERTQRIVATAHDAFVGMDAAGLITDWNPQAEATFGWSAEEAIGQPMHELIVPPKFREMHLRGIKHFLQTGDGPVLNKRIELPALHRDGRELPIELTISPIPVGDTFMFSAFLRDVSERKRAEEKITAAKEEAERANRAKSEFLSRMSHELRTPMNAILGFAQLLALEDLSAGQREGLGHILGGGEHLLELINEVLDISRIEAGRLSLSREPVEIAEAMREIIDLMKPLAAAAAVRLDRPQVVGTTYALADRQRLKQVLLNLVSNAIKYNRAGGSISLACEVSDDRARISVRDTGIGIPDEHLEQIFSPFERLGAEQGQVEGTGLGLTVTKRLVEVMEGTIGVESKVGEGSTFWIELALTQSPLACSAVGRPPSEIEAVMWGEGGTVLYVEDNFSNLKLVESLFRLRPALRLIAARDGKSGLQMAREQLPVLILLDLNLPDMNGRDVLTALRTEPMTSAIPVIALSADATPCQIDRLMRAGAADYLTKPINVQKFLEVLDRTLHVTTPPARRADLCDLRPAFKAEP